jgi:two-component system, OmpR family, sensor kinase
MKIPLAERLKRFVAPRSLRYQLLTRSLLVMAVMLLAIGLFQYWFMKDFLYKNKAEAMFTQLSSLPRDLLGFEPMPDRKDRQESNNPRSNPSVKEVQAESTAQKEILAQQEGHSQKPYFFMPDSSLAVVDENGNVTALSEEGGQPVPVISKEMYASVLEKVKKEKNPPYLVVEGPAGSGQQLVVFRPGLGSPGRESGKFIQMSTATAPLDDTLLQQLMIFVFLSGVALLAGIGVYLPVIRKTLVPLSRIGSAVQRTDAGNLNERLPIRQGQEEIDRLSESFNSMLERLDDSFQAEREAKEQMRRFIADASHELRTPLTSIHGFLEVLLRGAMDRPEQLKSALTSMHGESKRINKLVEDLLLLAKLDRAPQLSFRETLLDEVITEMEPQLKMLAGKRSIHITAKPGMKGKYDSDKIKQVLLNLFHNAVQHTDADNGKISVKLTSRDKWAELTIRDNGSGISEDHLQHVFDRFYRSESSRTRRSGGAGLGLSITKSLVEAHGGTIEVESAVGAGTSFIIRLPLL